MRTKMYFQGRARLHSYEYLESRQLMTTVKLSEREPGRFSQVQSASSGVVSVPDSALDIEFTARESEAVLLQVVGDLRVTILLPLALTAKHWNRGKAWRLPGGA